MPESDPDRTVPDVPDANVPDPGERPAADRAPGPAALDAALREALVDLAERAGRAILEVYRRGFDVTLKADASPLTEADLASHRLLLDGLRALTPSLPVLSEEAADEAPYARRSGWRRFWLVDPLDGTKEFVKRNGEFTVNIALIDDGAPVAGVVHAPVLGTSYSAALGDGAYRHEAGAAPERIRVRAAPDDAWEVVASRSHAGADTEALLAALRREREVRVTSRGSSLKFCLVAEGAADLYPRLGPTMEWDTAAAQVIVEAAGGVVVGLDGRPLRYNKRSLRNPSFLVSAQDPGPVLAHLPRP